MVNSSTRSLDRRRILETATRHFTRHGFRKASLADMAAELGVVKGALYYHFPGGKLGIFDAAARLVEQQMLEAMREAAQAAEDARRGLPALFAAKYDSMRARLAEFGVSPQIARELVAVPRELGFFLDGERRLIEELLARGEREGCFRRMKSRGAAAAAVQAMLRAPLIEAALSDEPPQRGERALPPAIFDVLIHGLAP